MLYTKYVLTIYVDKNLESLKYSKDMFLRAKMNKYVGDVKQIL